MMTALDARSQEKLAGREEKEMMTNELTRVCFVGKRGSVPQPGTAFRQKEKGILIVVNVNSHFVDQDEVDDNDDFANGGDPYWRHTAYCRTATDEESAPVLSKEAEAVAKAEAEAKAEAQKKQAAEAAQAEFERLVAGLASSGETYSLDGLETCPRETILQWEDGDCKKQVQRFLLDGESCYLLYEHYYDDDRSNLYASRAIIERSWNKWGEECEVTPKQAREWLKKYRGCAGEEAYEFIASTKTLN